MFTTRSFKKSILFVSLFILSFSLSSCAKEENPQQHGGGFAVNVVGYKARAEQIEEKINLVGSLEANESIEIRSEIDGKIDEIGFKEGEKVKKGQTLFKIDHNKLQAALDEANANLNLATTTAKRYEGLVKDQAVSQQEYDQTVANLESTKAAVALTKEQFDDATIKAAFEGIMGERFVSVGQVISKGATLSSLVDTDPMKANFHVSERYIGELKNGQDINIKVAAYPNKFFKGTVYFISPNVDELTRTILVKARVPNKNRELRPGMFANLDLIVNVRESSIIIPESAVMMNADKTNIFTVDKGNTAHLTQIQTGTRQNGMVEVTSGLKAGEIVVIEGIQKIREGASVNLRFLENEEETLTNENI